MSIHAGVFHSCENENVSLTEDVIIVRSPKVTFARMKMMMKRSSLDRHGCKLRVDLFVAAHRKFCHEAVPQHVAPCHGNSTLLLCLPNDVMV